MVAIVSGLLAAGCSVFGIRTEQTPPFAVVRTIDNGDDRVEVRRYEPRLVAETTVAGPETTARSDGFKRLAGYIFGGNATKTSIDMTAPVSQSQTIAMTAPVDQSRTAVGEWRIRFFMPAGYTLETLPRPNDPAVVLAIAPAETVAVLRYGGGIGPAAVHAAEQRLVRDVDAAGLTPEGAPFTWFYDPPWTIPPLRRNEAVVRLKPG